MKLTFVYGIGMLVATPSISISYLTASIKASGRHHATLIDSFLKKNKEQFVLDRLQEEKPDVIAFSLMSSYVEKSLELAAKIKQHYPGIKIITGGPHAILRPEELISHEAIDAVCTCEGENAMVEYLDDLAADQKQQVKGIWYRNSEGTIAKNEQRPPITDLDSLPFPDWSIWDHSVYKRAYMRVMASRGCPYECAYCCTKALNRKLCNEDRKYYYRVRSARNVIDEIKRNLKLYGCDGFLPIIFSDCIFGMNRKQFDEFVKLYIKEGLHERAPWRTFVVANMMNDNWARKARQAGCFAVDMGMEHSDEAFRINELNKKITNKEYMRAIKACRDNDLFYGLDIMFGYKGESFKDNIRNIFNALRLKPQYCSIFFFIPLPDTDLWFRYKATQTPQDIHRVKSAEQALNWIIKIVNQFAMFYVTIRLHGLITSLKLCWRYTISLIRKRPDNIADSIRLLNFQIQQYVFLPKLKDPKYKFNRKAFYKV